MTQKIMSNGRTIALVTKPLPVQQAYGQIHHLMDNHSFIGSDLTLLARAIKHPAIYEHLSNAFVDVCSSLQNTIYERKPVHVIEHTPEFPLDMRRTMHRRDKKKSTKGTKGFVEGKYHVKIYPDASTPYELLRAACSTQGFVNSELGVLLTGGQENLDALVQAGITCLDEEFLSCSEGNNLFIPNNYRPGLSVGRGTIRPSQDVREYLLIHPDFL